MAAIAAIILAAVVGFIVRLRRESARKAWLAGCVVVPAFVLFAEFVLPHKGGGASMWPIALLFGGLYGAAASGAGVYLAGLVIGRSGTG